MLEVIILASGQGSRMQSSLPKVLHTLAGQPLVAHVLQTARQIMADSIHVVVGHGAETVEAAVAVVVVEEDRIKTKYINDIVWKKISGLEFDNQNAELTFSKRLARENRWPHWYALDVIEEYRKFLYLLQEDIEK